MEGHNLRHLLQLPSTVAMIMEWLYYILQMYCSINNYISFNYILCACICKDFRRKNFYSILKGLVGMAILIKLMDGQGN